MAAVSPAPARDVRRGPSATLEQALSYGLALVATVDAFAAAFDLPDLELPPSGGDAAVRAALRVTAPLYLASELESARLLPAVETIAGLFVSGGLEADLAGTGQLLVNFWKKRHQRFTRREREAFFARLFGAAAEVELATEGARNEDFEPLMIGLCDELLKLQPSPALSGLMPPSEARVRIAGRLLAENLLPRTGGIAAFAAGEILTATQEALEILKAPAIQRMFGARSVWATVQETARRYLREQVSVSSHVVRAKEGQIILAWVADRLPEIEGGGRLLDGQELVIEAAQAWMEASLSLAQR
jgi:hypothetical protein